MPLTAVMTICGAFGCLVTIATGFQSERECQIYMAGAERVVTLIDELSMPDQRCRVQHEDDRFIIERGQNQLYR